MGSLPIMGIRGGHNEAKRATTTAAVTRFPLRLLGCRTSGSVLHPVGDFLPYLISREAGNSRFSVNAATSFFSLTPRGRQRGQTGKQSPEQRGKARLRSFSRSAGKRGADVHGGQKRSQKCASDQQEHVSQNVFCGRTRTRAGPAVWPFCYIRKQTRLTHTHTRTHARMRPPLPQARFSDVTLKLHHWDPSE